MNHKMKVTGFFKLVTISTLLTMNQSEGASGSTAVEFLKINPSARGGGMAGAVTALSNDGSSALLNPAGLAATSRSELFLAHLDHLAGTSYDFVSFTQAIGPAVHFGLSTILFQSGAITRTTEDAWGRYDAGTVGEFHNLDAAFGFSIAARLGHQASFGATIYGLHQQVDTSTRQGLSGTAGLLVQFDQHRTSMGIVLEHVGPAISHHLLPTALKIGLAHALTRLSSFEITVNMEGSFPLGQGMAAQFRVGGEAILGEWLVMRGGYRLGDQLDSFSAGVGVKLRSGWFKSFDYAMVPGQAFGTSHRFSLSLQLGEDRP